MEISEEQEIVLYAAITKYGSDKQHDMVIEECSELIQAICKHKRGGEHNILEECADVFIMLKQIEMIWSAESIQHIVNIKIKRLKDKLENN